MKWSAIAVVQCVCPYVCMCVCPNRELWPDRSSLEPDFLDISISLYLTWGGAVRISSALTQLPVYWWLDLEKKSLKKAINIVSTQRRGTRNKPWQGGWLKQGASATHSKSVVWLKTPSDRPCWRSRHYALTALWAVRSSGFVRYWAEKWSAHSQIPLAFSVLVNVMSGWTSASKGIR
jgi:hypothetical protein